MNKPKPGKLHEAYVALVERAVAAGWAEPGGLTPRELRARLSTAPDLPRDRLDRLTVCLEDSVYGGGTRLVEEGLSLCADLTARLPEHSARRGAPEAGAIAESDFTRLEDYAPVMILVVGLFFVLMFLGSNSEKIFHARYGLPRELSEDRDHYVGTVPSERGEIRAAEGDWRRGTHSPTWEDYQIPEVLDTRRGEAGFDVKTGTDHRLRGWKEPFEPPLRLHHRTVVFDSVNRYLKFRRSPSTARDARAVGGDRGTTYRAHVKIYLRQNRPVPVPSPTADARVLDWRSEPEARLEFQVDGADGLAVVANRTGVHELWYRCVGDGGYHNAPLPDTPMSEYPYRPAPLPPLVRSQADQVLAVIGEVPAPTYRGTVRRLHAYFNGFTVAPIRYSEQRGSPYLTVALARKGVCRHRAAAFVVTALAAGIPARYVTNEFHAFAEVRLPDGAWRRLEFRLNDGPVPYPPPEVDPVRAGLTIAMLLGFLLLVAAAGNQQHDAKSHLLGSRSRPNRIGKRAFRDSTLEGGSGGRFQIVREVLDDFSAALDLPDAPRTKLRNALVTGRVPESVRVQAVELLHLEETKGAPDRFALQQAYWCAKGVYAWLLAQAPEED